LSYSLGNLAYALNAAKRPHEAEQCYREAVAVAEKLMADYPDGADYFSAYGTHVRGLAWFLRESGLTAKARQVVEGAISRHFSQRNSQFEDPTRRDVVRGWYWSLAATLIQAGEHRDADKAVAEGVRLAPTSPIDFYNAGCFLGLCVALAEKDH